LMYIPETEQNRLALVVQFVDIFLWTNLDFVQVVEQR